MPVHKFPVLCIIPQERKAFRCQCLLFQYGIRGIIQLLIQPDVKHRDPDLRNGHTGSPKGDGIQQVLFKIQLHCLKQCHLPRLRDIPDIHLFQKQERAGIPCRTAKSILPAQGTGQCHRRNISIPLAGSKLPHKLISIVQLLALRLVQASPRHIGTGIYIVGSISHRQVLPLLVNMVRLFFQHCRKQQDPSDHVRADGKQRPVPQNRIVILPAGFQINPHGIQPQNIIHCLRDHVRLLHGFHRTCIRIGQFNDHFTFQLHHTPSISTGLQKPLIPALSAKYTSKPLFTVSFICMDSDSRKPFTSRPPPMANLVV